MSSHYDPVEGDLEEYYKGLEAEDSDTAQLKEEHKRYRKRVHELEAVLERMETGLDRVIRHSESLDAVGAKKEAETLKNMINDAWDWME